MRVIPLEGGPLDGMCHEVDKDWPCPDRVGLLHPDKRDGILHWYSIDHKKGVGTYEFSIGGNDEAPYSGNRH